MKCPICHKEFKVRDAVAMNLESYGKPAVAKTLCCKELVHVFPKFSMTAHEYNGDPRRTTDDWGN